jgi:G3E family GTPase
VIDARTPVFIVTGFLGSGKTTLVNRLVSREKESLVIVNEFGEVAVDHLLIDRSEEAVVALPNGCLCCRLRSDLEEALVGAAMRRRRGEIAGFDRVIVETSGIADPGPVAQTLFADEAVARDYRMGNVVTVVDTADAAARRSAPEIARAQIAAADLVVLSKSDRASAGQVAQARDEVAGLNPATPCVEARFGDAGAGVLADSGASVDFSRFGAAAVHPAGIASFVLEFPRPVARRLLEQFLSVLVDLRGADLLRVKGAVRLESGELVVVQGVRHVFDRLRPARREMPSALVFITNGISRQEAASLWQAIETLGRNP